MRPSVLMPLLARLGLVMVLLAGLAGGCADVNQASSRARRLTIVGTADLQGRLDPASRRVTLFPGAETLEVAGGISRIAALIREIRAGSRTPVIAVSAGDDLMGRYFHQFAGKAIFSLMAQAGYQVLALGNHEFDRGPGVLAEALEESGLSALCSDLLVAETVMAGSCRPTYVLNMNGLKVGFFSLMTDTFASVTVTGAVRREGDHAAVARDMVRALREQGATVVVALTHIGADEDRRLAEAVDGIDIIFGGHSHEYLPDLEQVGRTLIVNGGEKGAALVRLDVALDERGMVVPESGHYALLPVGNDVPENGEVERALGTWRERLPKAMVLGRTGKKWVLTKRELRTRESGVADLVTDLVRDRFDVDVVLINSGAFRGNAVYPPGPVTDVMIRAIDEFESDIVLLELPGRAIEEILEHSAARLGSGGFLQVSGIRLTIVSDPQSKSGSKTGSSRVRDIRVQGRDGTWKPLEAEHWYRVAANDFLVSRAGDGYEWFRARGRKVRNTYSTMGALLTDLFQEKGQVDPPEPDGRIRILGP